MPYKEQLGALAASFRADRGGNLINWRAFIRAHPELATKLGINIKAAWKRELSQSLSYFYRYHVTGQRKAQDIARKKAKSAIAKQASTPEQRAYWRLGHPRTRTKIQPIVARREDMDLPPVPASNGGLRGSLLRTIEQLQSLLKAIE